MKNLRTLFSVVVLGLLVLGYAASQAASLGGTATEYAAKIDCPPIQYLALAILACCVVIAFMRDEKADGG